MRRKEPHIASVNRGKSLISTRIQQHQQRKMKNMKSQLPRSYSSPGSRCEEDKKESVTRSFSTPEPKQVYYRDNSDSICGSKPECSKSELDSDLENYELFEDSFIDIDAEPDDITFGAYTKNPEVDKPKKVIATLLPGSGIHKISMKPISPRTIQKIQHSRQAKRKLQRHREQNKGSEERSLGDEELRRSPSIEMETIELEREFNNAEQHLDAEIAIATGESDTETV
ncbi:uncharacterized protein [Battus philenor]|uniref:uncharacterized protein n=1 Tax=Battus philenor TaxID=42288 RepID=UPI0035CF95B3